MSSSHVLGISATLIAVACSLVVAVLLPPELTTGWGAVVLTAMVPTLIVQTSVWRSKDDAFRPQPASGISGLAVTVAFGIVIALAATAWFGGAAFRPTPFVIFPLISTVPVALWQIILFHCWPFSALVKSARTRGLLVLATTYGIVAVGSDFMFNFAFLQNAPFYDATLDPGGLLDARIAVALVVASAVGVLALAAWDFWPVATLVKRWPVLGSAPLSGVVGLGFSFGTAAVLWWAFVSLGGLTADRFLARVCVSTIFGLFVLLIMLRGKAFGQLSQPGRGLLICLTAILVGAIAYALYSFIAARWLGLTEAGDSWVSTVMLAMTFPAMTAFADLFDFWPLQRPTREG